jgi:DNA polymerase-1
MNEMTWGADYLPPFFNLREMIKFITNQKSLFEDLGPNIVYSTVEECIQYFEYKDQIEFDTETTGFDPHSCSLISAQFGDINTQFVVDCASIDIRKFKFLLENKRILMQNAKFDLKFLYAHGIVPTDIYDTFLAESVLNMGKKNVRKGLDALVYRYTKQHMSKEVRGLIHKEGLSRRVIEYAAGDVRYLGEIRRGQIEKLMLQDLQLALDLDNKFVRVLAYVEYCGFKLDTNKWIDKAINDKKRLDDLENDLDEWLIEETDGQYVDNQLDLFSDEIKTTINWNSEKQVIPIMKGIGINTQTKDKKSGQMKDSIEANVIQGQKDKSPLVDMYLQFKKAGKLVSTFGMNVLKQVHSRTGRIHTTYRQILDTGRMSCGGKNRSTGEEYINLQQIPSDAAHRSCFVPEDGCKLIVADYSGQESVVFANFSKDPEILAFYQQGLGDMHSFIAQKIYPELEGVELPVIKSVHKQKRQNAKGAGFAIQYGGEGITIATNLGLSIEEGNGIYESYFKAFPGVKDYFAKCKATALANGYVMLNNISKRKSYVDFYEDYLKTKERISEEGFWDTYRREKAAQSDKFKNELSPIVREHFKLKGMIERKSLNYPIQGSSAECTKFAALLFFDWLIEKKYFWGVKICNIVHDEIVVECPEYMAEEIADKLKECMEQASLDVYAYKIGKIYTYHV